MKKSSRLSLKACQCRQNLTGVLGEKIEIVGDDSFCTNKKILADGILKGVANSSLIKEFVSHRSGETSDTFLSDLTVALKAVRLKTGSGCCGKRIEKFNQLIRIENELGKAAKFAGIKALKNRDND